MGMAPRFAFRPGPRVVEPGHFEGFVGQRLGFVDDVDRALSGPQRDVLDASRRDPIGDTQDDFNRLANAADDLDRRTPGGGLGDVDGWIDGLVGELLDILGQPLPNTPTPLLEGATVQEDHEDGVRRALDISSGRIDEGRRVFGGG